MTLPTSHQILAAALKQPGDSIAVSTYSPGGRALGMTVVRRYRGDSASISFFGNTIIVKFDPRGRLTSLSGERTTIKVRLVRVDAPPDIEAAAARLAAAEKAAGAPPVAMSPRDTARGAIGAAALMVDYGRPSLRGRTVLGSSIIQYDSVWRTGANAATQFKTTAPITLAGIKLDPGMYTLWTMFTRNGVLLIVNRQVGQWGTQYDATKDVARGPLKTEALATPVEQFTIRIEPKDASPGNLVMEWDKFRWTAEIRQQ